MKSPSSKSSRGILRSSLGVSFATFLSRVLGLFRVMLEARVLGGDSAASAWALAFAIPNTFRRMLGEGALGTALMPLVAEAEATPEGAARVRRELGVIFAYLGAILAVIVLAVSGLSFGLKALGDVKYFPLLAADHIQLMLSILPLLMPYAFFICLVGAVGAVLNTRKIFVLPALGALLLNFFLIGGLWVAFGRGITGSELPELLPKLSFLVLASGAAQLALMLLLLWKAGRFPRFTRESFRNSEILRKLWKLVLPGLIGGAALQISFLIDRMLAMSLGPKAVPALTYVDRIIDLPIGLFAIALGSVLTATMSHAAARGDREEIAGDLAFSLRHVYFFCIPMAVGVVFFWEPLMRILCLGGNYTQADLEATRLVAIFYGAGIPAFCSVKILLAPFYARKMMTTTLRYSLIAICANIAIALMLMWPLQQGGIALATVLASMLNNFLLMRHLRKEGMAPGVRRVAATFARSLLAAGIPGGALYFLYPRLLERMPDIPALAFTGVLFLAAYLVLSHLSGGREAAELKSVLRRERNA